MKQWIDRVTKVALPIWVGGYYLLFRSVVTVPLFAWMGVWAASAINFIAIALWSVIFYFLLLQVGSLDKFRGYLAQLEKRRAGFFLRKSLAKLKGESLISPWWIFLVFIISDAFAGVLIIRLSYPAKLDKKTLFLIIAGCALDVLTWAVPIYGLPIALVRKLAGMLFGGG